LIKIDHDCGLGGNVVNVVNEFIYDERQKTNNNTKTKQKHSVFTVNAFDQVSKPLSIIAGITLIKSLANFKLS
jgi:hypothetical protein